MEDLSGWSLPEWDDVPIDDSAEPEDAEVTHSREEDN